MTAPTLRLSDDMPPAAANPAVSVVIPTRGRRPLLEQTVASVRAQTLDEWEAIVVDDGSPDDTADWLARTAAADARVRPLAAATPGGGANAARNQGAAAARGRYVVFLDSDDLLAPDCLRLRAATLDARPDLDYVVNAMRCFRAQPGDADTAWNTLTDEDDFDRFLQMDGPWQTTGVTWRRSALGAFGGWDPAVLSLQDLDFHARALAAPLRYAKVNAWDCYYRMPYHRDAITEKTRQPSHILSHARIAHQLLDLPDTFLDATPDRRKLLSAFCFVIASRCAIVEHVGAALRLWQHARMRGTVGVGRFVEGWVTLAAQVRPSLGGRLRWRLGYRWPAICRGDFRRTLFNAPLPPAASDVSPVVVPVQINTAA